MSANLGFLSRLATVGYHRMSIYKKAPRPLYVYTTRRVFLAHP